MCSCVVDCRFLICVLHFVSLIVRTSSVSTFDSIELGRFSDDSNRDNEDRVAGR